MDEQELKGALADAIGQMLDETNVREVPRGILLEFASGENFLIPNPIELGADPDDSIEEEEYEADTDPGADEGSDWEE